MDMRKESSRFLLNITNTHSASSGDPRLIVRDDPYIPVIVVL